MGGANILVDPVLVGNLDFGIPWLYDAAKKVLKEFQVPMNYLFLMIVLFITTCWNSWSCYNLYSSVVQLSDLPEIDCLLITQSLDDHCHLKTLNPFSQKFPNVRVISTPNAKNLLDPLFKNVSICILSILLPFGCWVENWVCVVYIRIWTSISIYLICAHFMIAHKTWF